MLQVELSIKEIGNGWLFRYDDFVQPAVEQFYHTELEASAALLLAADQYQQLVKEESKNVNQ